MQDFCIQSISMTTCKPTVPSGVKNISVKIFLLPLRVKNLNSCVVTTVKNIKFAFFLLLRPDSTTAKFFARNCLCEIRMVGHEWFYWILSLLSPSQWVELNSTHWRSEFFAREERIQCNYSCAPIRISHKQFNFSRSISLSWNQAFMFSRLQDAIWRIVVFAASSASFVYCKYLNK